MGGDGKNKRDNRDINIDKNKTGNKNNSGVDNGNGKDEITDGDSGDDDANNDNSDLDLCNNEQQSNEMIFSNDAKNKHGLNCVEKNQKRSFDVLAINDEPSRKRTRFSYNCNIKENKGSIEPNINNAVSRDCNDSNSNDEGVISSTNGRNLNLDINSVGGVDNQSFERDSLSDDSRSVMTDILATINMSGLRSIVPNGSAVLATNGNGSESEDGNVRGNVNIINYVNIVSFHSLFSHFFFLLFLVWWLHMCTTCTGSGPKTRILWKRKSLCSLSH